MKRVNYNSTKRLGALTQDKIVGLAEFVLNQHTEIKWFMRLSETSISVYVYVEYNGCCKICRISDHAPNRFRRIHNIRLTSRTLKKTLIAFLEHTIESIKKKNYYNTLNEISINSIEQFNNMFDESEDFVLYEKEN